MRNTFYNRLFRCFKYVLLILPLLVVAISCDDFVDVSQPTSQLTGQTVFENKTTATAALKDIYSQMRDYGMISGQSTGLSVLLGAYTDELVSYETGISGSEPFYNNALIPSIGAIQEMWTRAYNQIYAANAVIEGVTNSQGIEQADKDQLIGEALFIRAFLHSYLAGIFGACPYITVTDYQQNILASRQATAEIYSLCITDLEVAVQKLPGGYISGERARPNKFAAQALLARLYLHSARWEEAANAASAVINTDDIYTWETDLDKLFLKESTTTIWQLSSGGGYANTQEGATFIFNAGPPTRLALRPELYNAFEPDDQRREHWIRAIGWGIRTMVPCL
ncbi:RagB/SusD family nutrient uptake outer membrane protein [Flavobacterium rivuli]|uniref:RagB/SusD family nutrient uptake outer membrane protein n=1 Tax=Flavobacterium rivuli TaxID=498301 RepID=UPI0003A6A310|nr:RagB/SusD family nutrient uptake outer membrane protein [Flavobacterium rivuli]